MKKKGQRTGFNSRLPSTGEKFVYLRDSTYYVRVTTHDERKDVYIGNFKTLSDAVAARDNYLSSL
jgi:hypothetical protein